MYFEEHERSAKQKGQDHGNSENNQKRQQMAVQIGAKPDSGFDDPIGMLKDCHRRIEHFLDILHVVAGRAKNRSLTEEERSAVKPALQNFHVGGERHTLDEEESLFPRLLAVAPTEASDTLARLKRDHGDAADLHASVDWFYTEWISSGTLADYAHEALLAQTGRLKRLYADHILVEETEVFPRAALTLGNQSLTEMGREFRIRRK
jgi:hemerythrin-like domain-containing protein